MKLSLLLPVFFSLLAAAQGDVLNSEVRFEVGNMLVNTVNGSFGEVSGEAIFSADDLENSRFDLSVKTSTIDTGNEKRDEHLQTQDFFDVANHPNITIRSEEISSSGDSTYKLNGKITMKGITESFETEFSVDEIGEESITLESHFTLSRETFRLGDDYGGFMIDDEIQVHVSLIISR